MTTYQRPSGAYSGADGLSNRTKYQEDAAAVPKVPISSSKIDGDFNYIIDALNTIISAAGSRSSIDDRLSVSLNDDGTLKASVTVGVDDWVADAAASGLTRVDDSSLTLNGDQTSVYLPMRRVRMIIGGNPVFGSVVSASYAASVTTLVLGDLVDAAGSATTVATAPSAIAYSYATAGVTGNSTLRFEQLNGVADAPVVRLNDTGASGKEYGLQSDGGQLNVVENTGTAAPVWTTRLSVNSSGLDLSGSPLGTSSIADVAVTTAKLADDAVSTAKMASGTADNLLGYNGSGNPSEVTIGSGLSLSSGTLSNTATVSDAATNTAGLVELATATEVGNETSSGTEAPLAVQPSTLKNHPGVANAWVYFDGTGTVSISDSYNVSSITDNGTGDYTINFTNAMADSSYSGAYGGTRTASSGHGGHIMTGTRGTSSLQILTWGADTAWDAARDWDRVEVMVWNS